VQRARTAGGGRPWRVEATAQLHYSIAVIFLRWRPRALGGLHASHYIMKPSYGGRRLLASFAGAGLSPDVRSGLFLMIDLCLAVFVCLPLHFFYTRPNVMGL